MPLPSSVDIWSIVCDKWDPFISLSPERPICYLIHPDGCIAAVVSGTNLITYLGSSSTEAPVLSQLSDKYIMRSVCFYLLTYILSHHNDCHAICLAADYIRHVIQSYLRTQGHEILKYTKCCFSALHCLILFSSSPSHLVPPTHPPSIS